MNEAALLSPGQLTRSIAEKLDREHLKRKEKLGSTVYKKKRNELKKKRKQRERKSYIQEPISYQSEIASSASLSEVDALDIPINLVKLDGSVFHIFWPEDNYLSRNSDITQIAAVHGSDINQTYVFPRHEILVDASKVTGITCCLATNKMYVQGKEVTYTTQYQALLMFIDFLKDIQYPVLVGHNICNFDMPVLTNRLKESGLFSTFIEETKGFVDTLKMAKRMFSKNEVDNYKQCTLVKHFIGTDYNAHNAIEDVRSLQQLFQQEMSDNVKHDDLHCISYISCKASFDELVKSKTISRDICHSFSRHGISSFHLQVANRRDSKGIRLLLQQLKNSAKTASALAYFSAEQWRVFIP